MRSAELLDRHEKKALEMEAGSRGKDGTNRSRRGEKKIPALALARVTAIHNSVLAVSLGGLEKARMVAPSRVGTCLLR